MPFSVIGKRVNSKDSEQHVTGRTYFAGDIKVPGQHVGVLLRSACSYGKLLHIDAAQARRVPGVKRILTGEDIPSRRFGRYLKDQYLLARDLVLYKGEPIAAIVAADEETALYARDLIRVEYEPMDPILDPSQALSPDSPLLHPELPAYAASWPAIREGNVCSRTVIQRGDVEEGFARSDCIVENVFETQATHQCPLETQGAVASRDHAGRLKVIMPTQLAFANQFMIAEALQVEPSRVCVSVLPSGGSFGSKIENLAGLYASLMAWHTDKPVKVSFSRHEEFIAVTPRHASRITVKTGVKRDGTLLAWQTRVVFDTGAYAWSGPVVTGVCTMFSSGPYRIPHVDLVGRCVYTNKLPFGAFRGYGNPQGAFAHESQMDIIAGQLGIDRLDIRLRNAVQEGDEFILGNRYRGVSLKRTIEAAVAASGWSSVKRKPHRGIGIACIQHVTGGLPSSIVLKVNLDGTISMMLGIPEIGTSISTIAAQIVSEELSVPMETIRVMPIDTDSSPYDHGLGISRSCFNVGHAARRASQDLKEQIMALAAEFLGVDRRHLHLEGGKVCGCSSEDHVSLPLKELVPRAFYAKGGPLIGRGSFLYSSTPPGGRCEGMPISGFPQITFGTQVAEIEGDPETGKLRVLKITAAHDVGKVINPSAVEGQIIGGVVQGIGYALLEELKFVDGRPANDNLRDYKVPTALDIPEIQAVIIEEPDPQGPFGAKGVGEPPIVATAPAIVNAVEDGLGIRIRKLPLTPERVLRALKRAKRGGC